MQDAKNDHYGVANWAATSKSTLSPAQNDSVKSARANDVASFFQTVWPASESYVSALQPIFLVDLPKLNELSPNQDWLVRDGLLPLIWFFVKNPEPGRYSGRLRIPHEFQAFVPDAWRKQVDLYQIFEETAEGFTPSFEAREAKHEVREILLMGLIMPSVCSLSRLEFELSEIVRFVGGREALSKVQLRAFLPVRFEETSVYNGPAYFNRYMTSICAALGTDIEYLAFESFQWMYPRAGSWVHEFNERWLYSDSYLTMLALSKGSRFIPMGPSGLRSSLRATADDFDRVFPAFPNVSFGVHARYSQPFINYLDSAWVSETQERSQAYFRAVSSAANTAYPWPKWFDSWCKEFVLPNIGPNAGSSTGSSVNLDSNSSEEVSR
jgi:hypothetical protein